MFSDAGGANVRRRRDLFRLFYFILVLAISLCPLSNSAIYCGMCQRSFLGLVPSVVYTTPSSFLRRAPSRFERSFNNNSGQQCIDRELASYFVLRGSTNRSSFVYQNMHVFYPGPTSETKEKLTYALRSMESNCLEILVDQRLRRLSTMIAEGMKMAAEGLPFFHQVSFDPVLPAALYSWKCSSESLTNPLVQPTMRSQLPPIRNSPPLFILHDIDSNASVERKLGFSLVGLIKVGPLRYFSWSISRCGGPILTTNRPRFFTNYFLIHLWISLSRHKLMSGRRLRSRLVSPPLQGSLDHHPTGLNSPLQLSITRPILTHWISLMARGSPLGPSVASCPLSLSMAHDSCTLVWPRSDLGLFPEPITLMYCYFVLNERGLCSNLVSTTLIGLGDNRFQVLSLYGFLWSECLVASILGLESPLSNPSFKKSLHVSSHWKRLSPSFAFMGIVFSVIIPMKHFIFSTTFVSSTDTFGLILMHNLMSPGGVRCFSTSKSHTKVTRLHIWGLNTMSLPMHLSFATNSLSFSLENLSTPFVFVVKLYCIKQRGCLIPSFDCKTQG